MPKTRRSGFSLVELLTVIAIIGILASVLFPVVGSVQKRARRAAAQTAMNQWATGVVRYKQTYQFYPNLGTTYLTNLDSLHQLETESVNLNFVMAISGRMPNGNPLPQADRRKLNRNAEAFCTFDKEDFEIIGEITINSKIVDRLGNRNIRVIFDTDNNSFIKNITPPGGAISLPEEIKAISTTAGLPARVIIYTTDLGMDFAGEEGLGKDDFDQIIARQ